MAHLGVELRGEQAPLGVFHGRHRAHLGARRDGEALGHAAHGVAVAHPHGLLAGGAVEQRRLARPCDDRRAVLALLGVAHFPAERHGHGLLPVAEAEHGNTQGENLRVDGRGVLRVHRRRAAGQDDGRRRDGAHLLGRDVAGHDFGIHVQITHATGDELPVLGAEIDDDDFLFRGSGLGHNASLGREMFEGDFTPPRTQRYFYEVKCRESAEWMEDREIRADQGLPLRADKRDGGMQRRMTYRRYFARRAWRFSGPKSRASAR